MAADLDAACTIAGINLASAGYELVAVGAPGRRWRRRIAEGPYQHGRVLLGAVLESQTLTIVVRCKGATWSEAVTKANALISAVSALSYAATVTIEGVTTTYACEAADVAMASGDTLDKFRAMAGMVEYQLTVPVAP